MSETPVDRWRWVLLGALLQGCGGAAAPAASPAPAQSAPEQSPSGGMPAESVVSPATPQAAPPPPPPSPAPPTDVPADRESQRREARAQFEQAARDLDIASSSCESACRALASMERATTHLCSLADQPDDQRRCEDARQRLLAARSRVRAACGSCG